MGCADLVPGVSGGTIALVLGIYERLVGAAREGARAIAALLRLDPAETMIRLRAIEWRLVVPVLVGILGAIVVLAGVLTRLLDDHPRLMSAVFFGLILGSIAVTLRDVERRDAIRLVAGGLTAAATFLLLGLRGPPLSDPALPVVFGSAFIAICGMILPGVSGAFILLMVGMYEAALAAISGRDLVFIVVFGSGAVAGLASFASLLKWLLERFHDTVMAVLIGLMAGSLRVLWMWPGTEVGDPQLGAPVREQVPTALAAVLVSSAVVYVLGVIGRPSDRVEQPDQVG
jgi:putative membrane protein